VTTPMVSYTKGTRDLVITPLVSYTKGTRHLMISPLVSYTKGTRDLVITPLVSYTLTKHNVYSVMDIYRGTTRYKHYILAVNN
jgi:hypothetical protein